MLVKLQDIVVTSDFDREIFDGIGVAKVPRISSDTKIKPEAFEREGVHTYVGERDVRTKTKSEATSLLLHRRFAPFAYLYYYRLYI